MNIIRKSVAESRNNHRIPLPSLTIAPMRKIEKNTVTTKSSGQHRLALAIAFLKPEGPRTVGSMIVVRTSGTEISMNNFKSQR